MAELYTAMAVMQGSTGLPEDRFVNTFHFADDAESMTFDAAADSIAQVLDDFYLQPTTGLHAGVTRTVFGLLSPEIQSLEYRVYRQSDPKPRTAEVRAPGLALPARAAPALPEEVAICLTLHTAFRSQRGRGRLYIGPLGSGGSVPYFTQAGKVRVQVLHRGAIAEKAADLKANVDTTQLRWVIVSSQGPVNEVIGGYVDDAFDTMRKRGTAPTVRTAWGTVQGIG